MLRFSNNKKGSRYWNCQNDSERLEAFVSTLSDEERAMFDSERLDGGERYYIDLPLHKKVRVTVYDVARCWGGPEEGGWTYDIRFPSTNNVSRIVQNDREVIDAVREELVAKYPYDARELGSVLGGYTHFVYVEPRLGFHTDTRRRYYE